MNPPKVRFLTKIYHPNIGESVGAHAARCSRVAGGKRLGWS